MQRDEDRQRLLGTGKNTNGKGKEVLVVKESGRMEMAERDPALIYLYHFRLLGGTIRVDDGYGHGVHGVRVGGSKD